MQSELINIGSATIKTEQASLEQPAGDFTGLLSGANITWVDGGVYLHVGDLAPGYAWSIIISTVRPDLEEVLGRVLPVLIEKGVGFRIVRNKIEAHHILSGKRGAEHLNKVIIIYPAGHQQANAIAIELAEKTRGCRGPAVPGTYRLGDIVFAQHHGTTGEDLAWPFVAVAPVPAQAELLTLNQKFRIVRRVKEM